MFQSDSSFPYFTILFCPFRYSQNCTYEEVRVRYIWVMKFKVQKNIILLVVLYGYETFSLSH
jgi:hypothetical protein